MPRCLPLGCQRVDRLSFILYTVPTMPNLINLTQARNKLSKVIEEVASKDKEYILIRDSIPQAVIIPYNRYQREEEKWQDEFEEALKKARRQFRAYLRKRKIPYPKTEEEMYELVNQATGRY